MSEIKPCPFCGSSDLDMRTHSAHNQYLSSQIVCNSCGVEGLRGQGPDLCFKYWNTRAPLTPSDLAALAEPMGLALVPVTTTGEMKAICIGEHTIPMNIGCSDCYDYKDENCEMCRGEGEYTENIVISWTTQKDIYKAMIETGRIKPKQAEKGEDDDLHS